MIERTPAENAALEDVILQYDLQALQDCDPPADLLDEHRAQLAAALNQVAAFVPSALLDPSAPEDEGAAVLTLTGTLMLVSINGLHVLARPHSASGMEWSEQLNAAANQLFSALFAEIYRHGGGVLKFGPTFITAFFDQQRLRYRHGILAAAAALAMQQQMRETTVGSIADGRTRIQIRIALHQGRAFAAPVGDSDHREIVIGGQTLNRAERLLSGVGPGEILVTDEVLSISKGLQTRPKFQGGRLLEQISETPTLPEPPEATEPQPASREEITQLIARIAELRPYTTHGLALDMLGAEGAFSGFRPVTALAIDCQGLNRLLNLLELAALEDPSIIGHVLNAYFSGVQRVVHQYEGVTTEIELATSSNRILALFGAPQVHEDDPIRAVRVAMDIHQALDAISAQIGAHLQEWVDRNPRQQWLLKIAQITLVPRIGIAAGYVFAGIVGSAARRQYTAIGETVQLAARLLSSGGAGIMVTSALQRSIGHLVQTQPLPAMILDEFELPIPIFQVISRQSSENSGARIVRHDAPLIGRDSELAQLLACSTAVLTQERANRTVVIVGTPGAGKSRLVEEALYPLYLAVPTAVVHRLFCHSYEQTTPYLTLTRLTRHLLNLDAEQDRALQALEVERTLDELVGDWSRFAPLLGAALNLPIPETDLTSAITPAERHDRLFDLIILACRALAAQRPLIVIVDDFQWVDASSRELFERLASELSDSPALLLLVTRPTPDEGEPWRTWADDAIIPLGDLDYANSAVLLAELLGDQPPPELRELLDRTRGTPLFLEEMVRYLQDSRVLYRSASGRWVCTANLSEIAIPSQIEQMIVARIDRLDPPTRALLEIAAVIGQQFSLPILQLVSDQRDGNLARLESLLNDAVLVLEPGAGEPVYQFKHVLTRDVTYNSISFARRRALHGQIARVIERIYAHELDEERVVLAEHYLQSGQPLPAYRHLVAAAGLAQSRYAHSEALTLYRRAIEIAMQHGEAALLVSREAIADLHEQVGEILSLTGDFAGAREHYHWYLDGSPSDPAPEHALRYASLWRRIGQAYENQGELDEALRCLEQTERCLQHARASSSTIVEYARMLSDTGWIYFRRSDGEQSQRYFEQALALIEGSDAVEEETRILNRLGGWAWRRGALDRAQHYVQRSLDMYRQTNNLVGQARALNNLGNISGYQGNLQASIDYGLLAIEINERIGNRRELAVSTNNVGYALQDVGDYERAHRYFRQTLEVATSVHDLYMQMQSTLNLGRVLTTMERWSEAEKYLLHSIAIVEQLQLTQEQLECYVALAELWLQSGSPSQAHQAQQAARALVDDQESEEYGRLQRLEARLALSDGDRDRAIALLQDAEQRFRRLLNMPEAERTRRLLEELLNS